MRPTELERLLELTFQHQRPTFTKGKPGIGKTKIHEQVADKLGMTWFPPLYPAMLDPTDVAGMPIPVTVGEVKRIERLLDDWIAPVFLAKEPGVLLIDEATNGTPAVQSCLAPLLDSRRVGRWELPKWVTICAAGNDRTHRTGSQAVLTHILSRTTTVTLEVDPLAWIDRAALDKTHPDVISFIKCYPSNLSIFDAEKSYSEGSAYPSPRSWYKVSDFLKDELPKDLESEVFIGTVGAGVTQLFLSHLNLSRAEVDITNILAGGRWKFPAKDKIGARYSFVIGLGSCATEKTLDKVIEVAMKLYQLGEGEYATVLGTFAMKAYPAMADEQHPAWLELLKHPLGQALVKARTLG